MPLDSGRAGRRCRLTAEAEPLACAAIRRTEHQKSDQREIKMRRVMVLACSAAIACILSGAGEAQELKLLAGWAENNVNAYWPGAQFKKNLEQMGGGKLTIKISGPEAVPPFEQLQPVSAGAFDMIYTHPT